MDILYIVTGANGHLGSAVLRRLSKTGAQARGLILPGTDARALPNTQYFEGDVLDPESLHPLFADAGGRQFVVIHTAGIVDISKQTTQAMYDVNVRGTKNIAALCLEHAVRRMVYVSSVHAIPEKGQYEVMREVRRFSPDWVTGGYAKTKAEATQAVLDAVGDGLNAVVVLPSGIIGPYDSAGNHLVQLISDYVTGKLPACVKGGYDFVDVRDVAQGCIAAAEKGSVGECYILSNRHYEVKDVLEIARAVCGGRRLPVLPIWMAKAAIPLLRQAAKLRKKKLLFTPYSLYTLSSNDRFSHDKATADLGYRPRDLCATVRDTVAWLRRKEPAPSGA